MCIGAAIGAAISTGIYVGRSLYVGNEMTMRGGLEAAAVGAAFGSGAALLPGAAAVVGAGLTGYSAGDVAVRAASYDSLSPQEQRAVKADAAITVLGAGLTAVAAVKASGATDFFAGTKYTPKVQAQ